MMRKSFGKITILIILYFICSFGLIAKNGHVILLKGRVFEASTRDIIATKVVFTSDKKKVTCKSNSKDGMYQQVLKSGQSYNVYFKGYIMEGQSNMIDIPLDTKYEEITKNFKVTKIKSGVKLFELKLFEPNKSNVNDTDNPEIKNLKNFIDLNPATKLEVKISSYDSWFKRTTKKIKKTNSRGKTYFKKVRYKTKEQLADLLDARITAIKDYFKSKKIFLKDDSFKTDLQAISPKKKKKKRKKPGRKKRYEYYTPIFSNVTITVK